MHLKVFANRCCGGVISYPKENSIPEGLFIMAKGVGNMFV